MARAKAASKPADVVDVELPDTVAPPILAGARDDADVEVIVELDPDPAADAVYVGPGDGSAYMVPLDLVAPSQVNPRDPVAIDPELVESIRRHGVIEPLLVAPHEDLEGSYTLIAGERRLRHAEAAGLTGVPVVVRDVTPAVAAELRLVENLQRLDLSPLEEARAFKALLEGHGYSQADVAAAISRNQGHVSKRLSLLKLRPTAQDLVVDGRLPVADAVSLSRLPGPIQDGVVDAVKSGLAVAIAVENAARQVAALKERTKVIKALDAAGTRWGEARADIPEGSVTLTAYSGLGHVDPVKHLSDECAWVLVLDQPAWSSDPMTKWSTQYCTYPANHPIAAAPDATDDVAEDPSPTTGGAAAVTDSAAQRRRAADQAAANAEYEARETQISEATARRSAHIDSVLAGKLPRSATEHLQMWLLTATAAYGELDPSLLDPVTRWLVDDDDRDTGTVETGQRAIARDGGRWPADTRARWALGVALASGEWVTNYAYRHHVLGHAHEEQDLVIVARHLSWLATTGLELDPVESAIVSSAPTLLDALDLTDADPETEASE